MANDEHYLLNYALSLKNDGICESKAFGLLLQEFNGVPYVWGGSSLNGSDCSGCVCTCLNVLFNKHIRVTADTLYKKYFTEKVNEHAISALFFLDTQDKAIHVAGYMGDGLYMNESSLEKYGAVPRTCEQMVMKYISFKPVLRSLGKGAWA